MKIIILLLLTSTLQAQTPEKKKTFYKFVDSFWLYRNARDTIGQYRILDSLDKYRKFDARNLKTKS